MLIRHHHAAPTNHPFRPQAYKAYSAEASTLNGEDAEQHYLRAGRREREGEARLGSGGACPDLPGLRPGPAAHPPTDTVPPLRRQQGRLYKRPTIYLSWDAPFGLCNQMYDHAHIFALAACLHTSRRLDVTLAVPRAQCQAVVTRSPAGTASSPRFGRYSWVAASDTLDLEGMRQYWGERGVRFAQVGVGGRGLRLRLVGGHAWRWGGEDGRGMGGRGAARPQQGSTGHVLAWRCLPRQPSCSRELPPANSSSPSTALKLSSSQAVQAAVPAAHPDVPALQDPDTSHCARGGLLQRLGVSPRLPVPAAAAAVEAYALELLQPLLQEDPARPLCVHIHHPNPLWLIHQRRFVGGWWRSCPGFFGWTNHFWQRACV